MQQKAPVILSTAKDLPPLTAIPSGGRFFGLQPQNDRYFCLLDVLLPPLIGFFQALLVGTGQIQMSRDVIPLSRRTDHRLDVLVLFLLFAFFHTFTPDF